MDVRLNFFSRLAVVAAAIITVLSLAAPAMARQGTAAASGKQRYIVILEDPPLAAYDGRAIPTPELGVDTTRFAATANRFTGARKLDVDAPSSKSYLKFLDQRLDRVRGESALRLGHRPNMIYRYRNALNGFATDLGEDEARALRDVPGVVSVERDQTFHLTTDSGPNWIGADKIHDGTAGYPASGGEGIVIGIIDSGINWDHPSFADAGEGALTGWDFVNPYGKQLGLCSKSAVLCNDKLVGVYDFVEEDNDTPETEEYTDGKDNNGHGSHVSSIAAGNPLDVTLNGQPVVIGGVAPNANIISYRVCYIGDPVDPDDDGCQGSAILSAIDQAITDKVDVVNYSIGADSLEDPWENGTSARAFLNLRAAGIFVATSAGNAGPYENTIGSPANAPWIVAVGNATHDRVFGSVVQNLSGGDTTPPGALLGASYTEGIGIRKIVHARDYGYPLCGIGEPESGRTCADNTGVSNPFSANTFNGEIVVCDRGTYGRVEKGKNLQLAGAGGYILANTDEDPTLQNIVADDHCLPAVHVDLEDGNALRAWLSSGSNHQGSLSGFSIFHDPEAGDRVASSSSRGPMSPPTQNILKPELIAPGTEILGAWKGEGTDFLIIDGTSMASPHVAGSAALLKAVHANWTPPMIASALTMTATPDQATDYDGSVATPHERGAGRPRLDVAVNAGLYLNETESGFLAANPAYNGDPRKLNLPGLVDNACFNQCSFQRTVTDLAGGASWSVSTEGFSNGAVVTVTPENFTLANGASRQLTVNIDLTQSEVIGDWVYGKVKLSADGLPDAVFTVAVYADGGPLPAEWNIQSDQVSGWQSFELSGLAAMPDATFSSGGLVVPTLTVKNLAQDPTDDDPYDGGEGVMTVLHNVPEGTLLLHAETLNTTAADVDLFVGRDTNGDGLPQLEEELCASYTPTKFESCDLVLPAAGTYWIVVENWEATNAMDAVTLKSAVVSKDTPSPLTATGDGIVANGASQTVRLSWDNVNAVPGVSLFGAVGIGTRREDPANIGIIPVNFTKTGVAAPETLVLMDGVSRGLTVGGLAVHDRVYFDVPEGTETFTVSTTVADSGQNKALKLELYRDDFDNAFANAPFVTPPDTSGQPLASATGTADAGPALTVTAGSAAPGRWFAVLTNNNGDPAAVEIRLDMTYAGTPVPLSAGLWQPSSRPGLSQGLDYATTGGYRALLWYTYDEHGAPAWYIASGPNPVGNVWVADLLRATNDGTLQQESPVGHVSVTTLAAQDHIFSFVLFGEEGSDRMVPSSLPLCPTVNNAKQSYTGIWSRVAVGVGGSSVLVNEVAQGYLHYIYDANGRPVWLIGATDADGLPHAEVPLLQFSGYCAVCSGSTPTSEEVGVMTLDYADESNMTWNLDYLLLPPLNGSVDRTDETRKLTVPLVCQ